MIKKTFVYNIDIKEDVCIKDCLWYYRFFPVFVYRACQQSQPFLWVE